MAYRYFKKSNRRTAADKALRDKTLKIRNMMDIEVYLLQWSIYFLIKKPLAVVLKMRILQTNN